jgi:membrane-bound metal-dependent hydrolase YbcI (DUF457 family)
MTKWSMRTHRIFKHSLFMFFCPWALPILLYF